MDPCLMTQSAILLNDRKLNFVNQQSQAANKLSCVTVAVAGVEGSLIRVLLERGSVERLWPRQELECSTGRRVMLAPPWGSTLKGTRGSCESRGASAHAGGVVIVKSSQVLT